MNRVKNLPFCTLDRLVFGSLLASGAFILLMSSDNLWGPYLRGNTKTIIYLLPWMLLLPLYSSELVTNKTRRIEIVLIVAIIILGALNVTFSQNPSKSYEFMKVFLLTGVFPLWSSMFLFTNRSRRIKFAIFCCCCLVIVVPIEIINFLTKGVGRSSFYLFTHNPIPLGTMVILLSLGPYYCLQSPLRQMKVLGWSLLILGLILIMLTGKRGTFIALGAMLAVWIFSWRGKYRPYLLTFLLVASVLIGIRTWHYLHNLDENNLSDFTIMHRLELYPFAFHIYKSHPVFGIGLRSYTHDKYLTDYQQWMKNYSKFGELAKELQTFDNMIVTGIVEMGSLMALAYFALFTLIIYKYCRKTKPFASIGEEFFLILPLIGFAVHSLTYDSLMFPQINWLVHVQLGILVGYAYGD